MASDGGSQADGWVYFIGIPRSKAIKIGWTQRSAASRLENLQTGCPVRLEILLAVPGSRWLEKRLHRKFAKQRIRREWFRESPALWRLMRRMADRHRGDSFGEFVGHAMAAEQFGRTLAIRAAYFARLAADKTPSPEPSPCPTTA